MVVSALFPQRQQQARANFGFGVARAPTAPPEAASGRCPAFFVPLSKSESAIPTFPTLNKLTIYFQI